VDFIHIIEQINFVIEHSAAQWWIIPLVSLFCLIDGFFLFLPSETAIVALSAIAHKTGSPNIVLLVLGASMGAIMGDNIAYFLGRKLGTTRFKWMRRPRGAKAFAWAGRELEKRGAILIFTARYIPVGRIAVNFTAGATHFPWRRFVVLDAVAVLTWATYSATIGWFAGAWVHSNPLLGIAIAITFAIVIGFIVDHAMKFLHHYLEKRGRLEPRPEPGLQAAKLVEQARRDVAAETTTGTVHPAAGTTTASAPETPGPAGPATSAARHAATPAQVSAPAPAEPAAVVPVTTPNTP